MCQAIAGGLQAWSQYQTGKYNEKIAKNNAVISRQMAADAITRGKRAEDAHRMKVASMKSSQAAKASAAGLDIGSGSMSDILADTAMMGELDALTIRSNAEREAYGHQVGATNFLAQGRLDRATGRNQAIGTILNTGSKVASQWLPMPGGG